MLSKNIGLIGLGVLGKAHYNWLDEKKEHNIKTYDIKNNDKLSELKDCDYIFIAVPTDSNENGELDIKIIELILEEIKTLGIKSKIIIRSTLPIGTIKDFRDRYSLEVYFMPEFLTERFAVEEFKQPNILLLGGTDTKETVFVLKDLVENKVVPMASKVIAGKSDNIEAVKLFTNSFYALKVIFANELNSYCEKIGLKYNDIKNILVQDPRIGSDIGDLSGVDVHFRIAQDGRAGFGGKCLPKDLSEVVCGIKKTKAGFGLLEKVEKINKKIRPIDK